MASSCFIVCFRSSVTLEPAKSNVSPDRWTAILARKDMVDSFVEGPDRIGPIFLDEILVFSYLRMNNRQKENFFQKPTFFLQVDLLEAETTIVTSLLDSTEKTKEYASELTDMIALTCLALFSSDKRLPSFLAGCISSTSVKVSALIHTDIAARWTLGNVSSVLCMSSSLLKKKLKEEGTTFSHIIINDRMRVARNLLALKRYSVGQLAEKCGFSNPSYFIRVFREYFGVSPNQYINPHKQGEHTNE
ncbi:AraC family transcriptional regulator [Escherichia coli]|nr:AraC family transcriptional regulator [Escherichia coli]